MNSKQKIGWKTAAALVISSMIGTGVFTSLGFQLIASKNTWVSLTVGFTAPIAISVMAIKSLPQNQFVDSR